MKTTLAIAGCVLLCVLLFPTSSFAQSVDANVVTDTAIVSGTIQITADDPLAIRALLDEPATIPGGYDSYLAAIFWTIIFGGLGGLVFELLRLRGNLALPYRYPKGKAPPDDLFVLDGYVRPKHVVDLGFLARVFVGSMAAIAMLLVISPPDRMKLLAAALIAGSAGASIFDTLRSRLQASLAVADATDVRAKSEHLQAQLDAMRNVIDELLAQSRGAGPAPAGAPEGTQELYMEGGEATQTLSKAPAELPTTIVETKLIDQLSRMLGEARGTSESITRRRPEGAGDDSGEKE